MIISHSAPFWKMVIQVNFILITIHLCPVNILIFGHFGAYSYVEHAIHLSNQQDPNCQWWWTR